MYPTKSLFDFQRVKNLQPAARITISFTITEKLGKAKVFFHISSIFHGAVHFFVDQGIP